MMTYNWPELCEYCGWNVDKILKFIKYVSYKKPFSENFMVKILKSKSPRYSFLNNPRGLIVNELQGTKSEQFIYLDLASKRGLYEFRAEGRLSLPIKFCNYDLNKLKLNRLLLIKDGSIHFVYEESSRESGEI